MKIVLIIILSFINYVHAQDLIIKNDKTEIKVKVIEISESNIKYRRWDNQAGPLYNLLPSDVFMIIYANGIREIIKSEKTELFKDSLVSKTPIKLEPNQLKKDTVKSGVSIVKNNTNSFSDEDKKTIGKKNVGIQMIDVTNKESKIETSLYHTPSRLVYWLISGITQVGLQKESRLKNNNLNWGLSWDAGFASLPGGTTLNNTIGVYVSPYISANKLGINLNKSDQGLYGFARVGGSGTISSISSDYIDQTSTSFGVLIGLGIEYFINNKVGLNASLNKIGKSDFTLQIGVSFKGKSKNKK